MSANRERMIGVAVAGVALLLLIGALVFWFASGPGSASSSPGGTSAEPSAAAPRPLRVGFIVSQATASGRSWAAGRRYPQMVGKAFNEALSSPRFEVVPVVEPGTAQSPELEAVLRKHFSGRDPIECTDDAGMGTVDVFFAQMVLSASPEMTAALEKHVRDQGKGLYIRVGFGIQEPGFTPPMLAINGMKEAVYGWNGNDQVCRVVGAHAAMGNVKPGSSLNIEPNGAWGVLAGEALAMVDPSVIEPAGAGSPPADSQYILAPFRVAEFGKGRVFVASYLGINNSDDTVQLLRRINSNGVMWTARSGQ